jgi:hypothetical protein
MLGKQHDRVALYVGSKNRSKFEDLKKKAQTLYYEKYKVFPTNCTIILIALEKLIENLTDRTGE